MEVDYPNCNGRFHRMCDDSVTVRILTHIRRAITLRIAMAVCRKWRKLIKENSPIAVDCPDWWDSSIWWYLRDRSNTETDMECLRPFIMRHPTRQLLGGITCDQAISTDRPSVVRM